MYVKIVICPYCGNREELIVLLETPIYRYFFCKKCKKLFSEVINESKKKVG